MRLRNQFAAHAFRVPADHKLRRITDLIDRGLVTAMNEHGFPFTTALGDLLLANTEAVFTHNAALAEIDMVRLPTAMKTDTLERGQKLGDQFRSKIMHLTGSLADHHVVSSPETLFIQLGRLDQISHSQLPIRHSYLSNLHRQKTNGGGALHPQQIKIFGGMTVAKPEHVRQEIALLDDMVTKSFQELGVPAHREDDYKGFDHEYFYICDPANEGENLALPGISSTSRVKAYSMGMIYDYTMMPEYRLRFRNEHNNNKSPGTISYGFCTTRILHCALHAHHDDKGFNLKAPLRPFDVTIIPADESSITAAEEIYKRLRLHSVHGTGGNTAAMNRVCLDDRVKIAVIERQKFAEFISAPVNVVVGKDGYSIFKRDGQSMPEASTQDDAMTMIMSLR